MLVNPPAIAESAAQADARVRHARSVLPSVALAFVALCLLALTLTPLAMTGLLGEVRARSDSTTYVAGDLADSVRVLVGEQFALHGIARMDPTVEADMFRIYRSSRALERRVLARLRVIAPRVDPQTARELVTLERALEAWHFAPDARADGRLDERGFAATMPGIGELRDSVLAALTRFHRTVEMAEARNRAEGTRVVARQRTISLSLGVLAALSLALIGWLAYRERTLARALSAAVRAEGQLRVLAEQRREDLVKVNASKSRLVRGFTHDVKNPIGAADGFLQLLEDGIVGPVTDRQAASLGKARRAIRSALGLIGDLLEVERVESGHLTVERVPTDVCALAAEVAEEFRAQAETKGLAMTIDVTADTRRVESDPARVRQVIGNLLSNAVKYTPAGGVTVRVRERGEHVLVEVQDTGPGIPAEKRRLLFQEFTRLDPTAAPGVGIGLAMARRITEALGGDLSVRSEDGQGSTFVLSLPIVFTAAA